MIGEPRDALGAWLLANIPHIPQSVFDEISEAEAARLHNSYTIMGDVRDLLTRDLTTTTEIWATQHIARRAIVDGVLAVPCDLFAPYRASRRGDEYAVSRDGKKVHGIVRPREGRDWLTRREDKLVTELFERVPGCPARRDYDGDAVAPPISARYHISPGQSGALVSAWLLNPLDHAGNLRQMYIDARGLATLYARKRGDDEPLRRELDVVTQNIARYIELFELAGGPLDTPILEGKLGERVTVKLALRKLNGEGQ